MQIATIETGEFRLDGGAMFGVVPKVLWEKTNPSDEKNRIQMALRSLVIRIQDRTFLVDTGVGEKWTPKQIDMFAIDHRRFQMDRSLQALGIRHEEVTDVIITHLHFDHVGGATRREKGGYPVLTFPNATYYVQNDNLTHAHAPTEKDRASFLDSTIEPLMSSGRLKAVQGNVEFAKGISAWVTHGHTPGHQCVKVEDGNDTYFFTGDTIPTSSHIHIPYVMAFDLHPLTTMEEKKQILSRAVEEKWILCFIHDPFLKSCTVRFKDGRYSKDQEVDF